jgi:hypothetical protein
MTDMSTIDMPETQEDEDDENHEDEEPGDIDSVLSVTVATDPVSWFADVDYAMMDANRPVNPVGSQFQGRDGKWMSEDNDLELKHSALDCFMAAFPPNGLKSILILTTKKVQNNKGKEIELGELLWFFGDLMWTEM